MPEESTEHARAQPGRGGLENPASERRALISAVIPCYEEEPSLEGTVRALVPVLERCSPGAWELVLVDDGSRDATWELAQRLAREPRIRAARHATNRGKGAAVRTGVLLTRGDAVLVSDADGSTPPEALGEFLRVLGDGADIAIGIFNRSYYEEVLVVRVHPAYLDAQRIPEGLRGKKFWMHRFESINAFERHLDRNGTKVVKFFLNVSKAEQKRRFLARLDEPEKNWKFSLADVEERAHWDAYQDAYERALSATSTPWAPWYVIPADHKDVMRALVAAVLVLEIEGLHLEVPTVPEEDRAALEQARARLEAETAFS